MNTTLKSRLKYISWCMTHVAILHNVKLYVSKSMWNMKVNPFYRHGYYKYY